MEVPDIEPVTRPSRWKRSVLTVRPWIVSVPQREADMEPANDSVGPGVPMRLVPPTCESGSDHKPTRPAAMVPDNGVAAPPPAPGTEMRTQTSLVEDRRLPSAVQPWHTSCGNRPPRT